MANSNDSGRTTQLNGNPLKLAGPELKRGDIAPDFEAVSSSMQPINLDKTGSGVRIFSVLPSLDTPVCDAQTKRLEDEASKLPGLSIYTISMDLPFAQQRWCGNYGIDRVIMISDHRTGSFGEHYGTLIPDLRIESRAIFVLDGENRLRYVEYVKDMGSHPDYEAVLEAARSNISATVA